MDHTVEDLIYDRNTLQCIIRKCIYLLKVPFDLKGRLDLKEEIKKIICNIWLCLGADKPLNTDTWLLHSRTGILGLYVANGDLEKFFDELKIILSISSSKKKCTAIRIPSLLLEFKVTNLQSFYASICHGVVNMLYLISQPIPSTLHDLLYNIVYKNCCIPTRYTQCYFGILSKYISHYNKFITPEKITDLFNLVICNFDKKDSLPILLKVAELSPKIQFNMVFTKLMKTIAWNQKFKYIMLEGLITYQPKLLLEINPQELVDALVFAQSKAYLNAAAGKLYVVIMKYIKLETWKEYYYPTFEKELRNSETPTPIHIRLFKYYMPVSFTTFPEELKYVLVRLLEIEDISIYSVLKLVLLGSKQGILKKDESLMPFIVMGLNDYDCYIRTIAFELLATHEKIGQISLERVERFIIANVHSDQETKECITKSFDTFLKRLKQVIGNPDTRILPLIVEFLNRMISFLVKNFDNVSSHQRISVSLHLVATLMKYFPKYKYEEESDSEESTDDYFVQLVAYDSLSYTNTGVSMIILSNEQQFVNNFIFRNFMPEMTTEKMKAILKFGRRRMSHWNFQKAEEGERLVEFSLTGLNSIESPFLKDELQQNIKILQVQWNLIRNTEDENIVMESNPLHSIISLISSILQLYDSERIQIIFDVICDIVEKLLDVFGLRAMLPYNGDVCLGIVKVLKDTSSQYFTSTLNCMWLVLKASCKFVSKLIKLTNSKKIISKGIALICDVIKRCYHKGGMDTAAEFLKEVVSTITQSDKASIIDEYLNKCLSTLIKSSDATTTSRKSAEIRMVINGIAVGDKRKNKPLFHKAMKYLISQLDRCTKKQLSPHIHSLILYCMEPLLKDSTTDYHALEYLSNIAVLTCESFNTDNWTIRNAVLQIFRVLCERILGPNLSEKEEYLQERPVSLEEVFFNYPELHSYILKQLVICDKTGSEQHSLVPVLTFIGSSYTRGKSFSPDNITIHIVHLKKLLYNYLFISTPKLYEIAARAYASISEIIPIEICSLTNRIHILNTDNTATLIAHIFALRGLCEKILNGFYIPSRSMELMIDVHLNVSKLFADFMSQQKLFAYVLCAALLPLNLIFLRDFDVSLTMYTVSFKQCIQVLAENEEMLDQIPSIWHWFGINLANTMSNVRIDLFVEICKICLENNVIPLAVEFIVLKEIAKRYADEHSDKDYLSKNLMNPLMTFVHSTACNEKLMLIEHTIKLILSFNPNDFGEECVADIKKQVLDVEPDLIRPYCIPIYTAILSTEKSHPKIRSFFLHCLEKVKEVVKSNSHFALIRVSVGHIFDFAHKHTLYQLEVVCMTVVFGMLQNEDESIRSEAANLVAKWFGKMKAHPYISILNLIKPVHLHKYFGTYYTLRFLAMVYVDLVDSKLSDIKNPFDVGVIPMLDSCVLRNELIEHIKTVTEIIPMRDRVAFNIWFTKYMDSKPLNSDTIILRDYFQQFVGIYFKRSISISS